jgi:5-formyltetrahydrofolate cyclo-ligase
VSPEPPTGPRGKPVTRRTVLSRRDSLTPEERAIATARIAESVEGLLHVLPAGAVVGLYAAKGTEVATDDLDRRARALGLRVAYPRVIDGARQLVFGETTIGALVTARFGLREPGASATEIALTDVAAFIVPGIAFDRGGGRIGWGHGHYDATLSAAPAAVRIGIAFECQVLDHVPRDPHDALLHHVVTEVTSYRR